jgi:holin-like protein
MIEAVTAVLLCQLAGEGLARLFGLPVPGPVIGLALMFAALVIRGRLLPEAPAPQDTPLGALAGFLLANLSLLFVPAGVGIIGQSEVLARHGTGLIAALVVSTAATLAVTALVFKAVSARLAPDPDGGTGDAP